MGGMTIRGTGRYNPGTPVTNADLAKVMDTSDDWIRQRTGIEQRHFAAPGEGVSDMGTKAATKAIDAAGLEAKDIDYIIFATMTPDYPFPGSGGIVGANLGIPGVPALDIRQQCAAVPFGLQVAQGLMKSGAANRILFVGADAHAGFMPWFDWDVVRGNSDGPVSPENYARATEHRGIAVVFGDGAGAFVLERTEGGDDRSGLLDVATHTDGRGALEIYIPGGGYRNHPSFDPGMFERAEYVPRMQGREVFKNAVTRLPKTVRRLCQRQGIELDEIDWFIAHQANDRINVAVRDALKLPADKVPSNIARYGNTSAGTIPILLDEMWRDGRLQPGQLLCLFALGAGLNWGAALLRL